MNENQIKRAWKIKSRYLFPPWIGYEYNKEVLNSGRRVPAMFQNALRSSVICLDMAEFSYKVVDPTWSPRLSTYVVTRVHARHPRYSKGFTRFQ